VVDRAASDGIALLDRPFHGGDSTVTRQQGRVKSDASQSRACKCIAADARMAMCRHDQIGSFGDGFGWNNRRIIEHDDIQARGLRRHG